MIERKLVHASGRLVAFVALVLALVAPQAGFAGYDDAPSESASAIRAAPGAGTSTSALSTARIDTLRGYDSDRQASQSGAGVFLAAKAAKGGLTWSEQSGILRASARGKGNFGVGSATAREADDLGRAWVGEGYTVASDGKTLVSAGGLRQYRPPSYKATLGRYQANLERRFEGQRLNQWQGNAHLDITDLP